MTCLCRTHSSPSVITRPLPNMGSLSCLNTEGFPQLFPNTLADIVLKNSGSATYKNGSVPSQYINTFPAKNPLHVTNKYLMLVIFSLSLVVFLIVKQSSFPYHFILSSVCDIVFPFFLFVYETQYEIKTIFSSHSTYKL